ncbi:zonadhesin [Halyomorpha halys]|uniref:zonadhesin n=1 Tax=Halyomorpha halys TaxID=286706 RepID=UPI0006D4EB2F|nr:uncharacterized protein LOC106689590 [Halyomorpha halys]
MACPLEKPNCKRKLMANNKIFEKKQCPLNIKPVCSLSPPACPLLPQRETKCGYAKMMGVEISVDQCPCKTCSLAKGCPISLNPCPNIPTDDTDSNAAKWPDNIPPCLLCTDGNPSTEKKQSIEKAEQIQPDKINTINVTKVKNTQNAPKCSLISSPRPLPCSECILQDFSPENKNGQKSKSCPYLVLPNVCGKNCYCPDVPSVETGPLCPFAPKPCPCCATPRCPLSRKPDCILQPKPPCCLQPSKCGICDPGMCPSSLPCCCGLCLPCSKPVCGICCPGLIPCCPTPPCIPCPVTPDGCCGPCPLIPCSPCLPPCAPSSLCTCLQPACPLVNSCLPTSCISSLLCTCSQPSCPIVNSCCCSPTIPCSSPGCITCLLKKLQCFLDPCSCPVKSICPPIPPPCSLITSDSTDPSNKSKENIERTFHLPTCPSYIPPCGAHMSLKNQCPFSPNPCPIGCECPFPVSMSFEDKHNGSGEVIIKEDGLKNKGQESQTSSKSVKFDLQVMEEEDLEDSGNEDAEGERKNQDSQCPYSPECGATPLPTCPAAEFLCPDKYIKPKIEKKKPCPFKKCMKKPGCPLGKLKPEVDCKLPGCPLTKEPDCPLGELVKRCQIHPNCSCSCLCPPLGCSVPLPCPLNVPCECTSTDGHSRSIPPTSSADSIQLSSYSSSSFTLPSLPKRNFLDLVSCESNFQFSISNILLKSSSSLNSEKPAFDGCCCKNNYENLSGGLSENTLSSSECPLEPLAPKRICRFAPPKCPLTPKPTSCPLTRKPDPCALSSGGELICPVQYPPCKKFPSGRCPMGDINVCDCEYPVSPCMLPLQDKDVVAPPQYCYREDCCMGLPYPPSVLRTADGGVEKGPYYQFKDTKPGKEETKHYVQISKVPPDTTIALFGLPRERVHSNWTIVKHGEGYRRCKTIAKKLKEMGPIRNFDTQYDPVDCPIDEETQRVIENRKKQERELKEFEHLKRTLGIHPEGEEPKNKKNKKRK